MKPTTLTKILPIGGCLVLLVSGCLSPFNPSWPLLYKPDCDLAPVLAVHLPGHINTLATTPRTKTIAENGINKNTGERQVDNIKELFYLERSDVQYEYDLFFDEADALHHYEFIKHSPLSEKYYPVLREVATDGRSGCLFYTEQERGEFSHLSGNYCSRVMFRLHNVLIRVTTQDKKPQSDKLDAAVKNLAQMLNEALSTNQMSQ